MSRHAMLGMMAAVIATLALYAPADEAKTAPPPKVPEWATKAYHEIVSAYLEGRWANIETLLRDKAPDLVGLTAEQQADISAIRLALKEGRQPWWTATKTGAKTPIQVMLWGRTIPVLYDPGLREGSKTTEKNGRFTLTAGWPSGDMDSTAPAEHGFTKGDAVSLTAFSNLGTAYAASALPVMSKDNVIPEERYLEFRGKVTGIAYGTPGARRYGIWICLCSYNAGSERLPVRMAQRAVAAMFLGEVLTHPEAFPSVELPKALPADKAEETLCKALADVVEKHPWTIAEDNALRNAVKFLAGANQVDAYNAGVITLANKLTVELDPKADEPKLVGRNAWLKQQFDKAQKGK